MSEAEVRKQQQEQAKAQEAARAAAIRRLAELDVKYGVDRGAKEERRRLMKILRPD